MRTIPEHESFAARVLREKRQRENNELKAILTEPTTLMMAAAGTIFGFIALILGRDINAENRYDAALRSNINQPITRLVNKVLDSAHDNSLPLSSYTFQTSIVQHGLVHWSYDLPVWEHQGVAAAGLVEEFSQALQSPKMRHAAKGNLGFKVKITERDADDKILAETIVPLKPLKKTELLELAETTGKKAGLGK